MTTVPDSHCSMLLSVPAAARLHLLFRCDITLAAHLTSLTRGWYVPRRSLCSCSRRAGQPASRPSLL